MGEAVAAVCAGLEQVFPALGRYACHVVAAYGGAAVVLGALIWATLSANRRARAALEELERERRRSDG